MHKKLSLYFCCIVFSSQSFAAQEPTPMEIDEPAQQQVQPNPFDLITDDNVIRQISDWLDQQSCGRMRQVCKRFNNAVWQYDKPCEIASKKGQFERQSQYWERVYALIAVAKLQTGRHKANNKIILFPRFYLNHLSFISPRDSKLYLPELPNPDVDGFRFRCDFFESAEIEKIPHIFPNFTFLDLIACKNDRKQFSLPTILYKLTNLQTLHVKRYNISLDYIECLPAALNSLNLDDHCLLLGRLDFRKIAHLNCLRSLSLKHMELWPHMLDAFALLAPNLEKLCISGSGHTFKLEQLLSHLASFEKLKELDISQNDLNPEALTCLTGLKNLRWINLAGNRECESQKDLVRSMFPPTVTISYDATIAFA